MQALSRTTLKRTPRKACVNGYDLELIEDCYFEHNSTIFSEMLGEDEEYLRLKKAKRAAEEALQSVISKEAWNQYLALDEICNELECARYKAMYLAGAADYEKLSK